MYAIIMPVFQGARYLCDQIDSILSQTVADFRLYIRDDGSSDGSRDILDAYAARDSRIVLVEDRLGRVGVTRGIKALLRCVNEGVVFLADQDDYWLPHKAETMISVFEFEAMSLTPMAVFSDLLVADCNLNPIASSYWELAGIQTDRLSFQHIVRRNCLTGCAAAVNKALAEIAVDMPDTVLHDWWIAAVAAKKGRLIPVSEGLVWYRQHRGNAIGAGEGGLARLPRLWTDSLARQRYALQLCDSITHLRALGQHPYFSGRADRMFIWHERIRRTLFWYFLSWSSAAKNKRKS
jgi:glycosyltransferase involved in cell wall biosynthesis